MKKQTLRVICNEMTRQRWFTAAMWLSILTSLVLTAIHVFIGENLVSEPVFTAVHIVTCVWFVFEMATRIVAQGKHFFNSRKNIFDLCMCTVAIVLRVTTFGALRLLRGLFVDPTGTPHKDGASGTKR